MSFLTEKRKRVINGDKEGMTENDFRATKSQTKKAARTAFQNIIEVAYGTEIDNESIFNPSKVNEFLTGLMTNGKQVIPKFDYYSEAPYREIYDYQNSLLIAIDTWHPAWNKILRETDKSNIDDIEDLRKLSQTTKPYLPEFTEDNTFKKIFQDINSDKENQENKADKIKQKLDENLDKEEIKWIKENPEKID